LKFLLGDSLDVALQKYIVNGLFTFKYSRDKTKNKDGGET
jgi:hypothetical protein